MIVETHNYSEQKSDNIIPNVEAEDVLKYGNNRIGTDIEEEVCTALKYRSHKMDIMEKVNKNTIKIENVNTNFKV